jgi:hypothetical protein
LWRREGICPARGPRMSAFAVQFVFSMSVRYRTLAPHSFK